MRTTTWSKPGQGITWDPKDRPTDLSVGNKYTDMSVDEVVEIVGVIRVKHGKGLDYAVVLQGAKIGNLEIIQANRFVALIMPPAEEVGDEDAYNYLPYPDVTKEERRDG